MQRRKRNHSIKEDSERYQKIKEAPNQNRSMVYRKMEKGQEQRERLARSKVWAEMKRIALVMKELKQRISEKATKVKRYDNRIKQFQDDRNLHTNQGRSF